jgi:hypothetical protein
MGTICGRVTVTVKNKRSKKEHNTREEAEILFFRRITSRGIPQSIYSFIYFISNANAVLNAHLADYSHQIKALFITVLIVRKCIKVILHFSPYDIKNVLFIKQRQI